MCVSKQQLNFDRVPERGFTLIEVLVSITITMIVMASVFALLTQGQRSFQREPEIADLQQSARTVLDMVSRDILQAGSGLPPEFPAFSSINGAGDNAPTDVLEMIGAFQFAGELYLEPEVVAGFDPGTGDVQMLGSESNFQPNDMIIVYNDTTTDPALADVEPQWALAQVVLVTPGATANDPALIQLNYNAYDPQYSWYVDGVGNNIQGPGFMSINRLPAKMARVSVVRYFTQLDNPAQYSGPPPQVLMKDVDFAGNPQPVGYLEDFQITYTMGVAAPAVQDNPPNPRVDLAGIAMTAENMLSGVRVTVTARSVTAGMQGATEGGAGREDDFIRKTFSTNVNPRNISAGMEVRTLGQ